MSGNGNLEDFSVDQAAGAVVLVLGAVASLLLVIWQSRCECDMNLCYIIRCHRKPPPDEKLPKKKPKDGKVAKAKDIERQESVESEESEESLVPTISVEEEEEPKLKEIINVKDNP